MAKKSFVLTEGSIRTNLKEKTNSSRPVSPPAQKEKEHIVWGEKTLAIKSGSFTSCTGNIYKRIHMHRVLSKSPKCKHSTKNKMIIEYMDHSFSVKHSRVKVLNKLALRLIKSILKHYGSYLRAELPRFTTEVICDETNNSAKDRLTGHINIDIKIISCDEPNTFPLGGEVIVKREPGVPCDPITSKPHEQLGDTL